LKRKMKQKERSKDRGWRAYGKHQPGRAYPNHVRAYTKHMNRHHTRYGDEFSS